MEKQRIESQKGEIEGEEIIQDEYDRHSIEVILKERMKKTFDQMTSLKATGRTLSPYIEIGAERGQRSLIMENEIGAAGAAVDISFDMLKSCDHYAKVFVKNKLPMRICCDANVLPFASASIPFIFCYQTLHHFPNPIPIIEEIHRVLSLGGNFFFDEEPYRKVLHLSLYASRKIHSKESLNANKLRKILDHFCAKESNNEIEYGITENDEISLMTWRNALNIFDEKEIIIQSVKHLTSSELFKPRNYAKYILAYLLGGTIFGTCRKTGIVDTRYKSIMGTLICPSCLVNRFESPLVQKDTTFSCMRCKKDYPVIDGVVFLFTHEKFEELYPDLFHRVVSTCP
jgi:ubiquinone/menaquinone biosynthesis C-methylase UbiE